jgi:uncharacterized protein (TIGR00290 family)
MSKSREPIFLAWSGGKDSMMALYLLKDSRDYEVVGLISCITQEDARTRLRGVGRDLLEAQASALGLPLVFASVSKTCCFTEHTDLLAKQASHLGHGSVRKIAFGDLYLDDVRDSREECLEALGMEAIFPLWHRDTAELAQLFLDQKFKAMVTCVDQATLDEGFVGRMFDRDFLYDLPIAVDPCGENGEFHTFVYAGPLFAKAIAFRLGAKFTVDRFHYCDLSVKGKASSRKLRRSGTT